jgi:RimJ/RimL family protein N-acetyltransferase
MSIEIVYANPKYFAKFHANLNIVAREKIYIEMIEAMPLEKLAEHQSDLISRNAPVYYAVDGENVVGWCDVSPSKNPRLCHRGGLGMGLLPDFRGQGLGSRLMTAVFEHSKKIGLEKIELQVYTSNLPAIALYKKFGFEPEGLIRKYRKLDGKYFDALAMAKFLTLL